MKKFLFIAPALKFISEGRLFSRVFAIVTRVLAGFIFLGTVVSWLHAWHTVFDLHGFDILGGIIFQIVFLAGIWAVTQVLWIRAGDIATQPSSGFTVIPIVSIFLRMLGEVYACLFIILGVGGCSLILFAGIDELTYDLIYQLPTGSFLWVSLLTRLADKMGGASTFPAAIVLLVCCLVVAYFVLVIFYLLAEVVGVLVDIARDIRTMRRYYDPSVPQNPGV